MIIKNYTILLERNNLEDDLKRLGITFTIQSIVETFIESNDNKEIIIYTSLGNVKTKESIYQKTVLQRQKNIFKKIVPNKNIESDEFYKALFQYRNADVSHRMRISFTREETEYTFDFDNEKEICLSTVKSHRINENPFRDFISIKAFKKHDESTQALFYRYSRKNFATVA